MGTNAFPTVNLITSRLYKQQPTDAKPHKVDYIDLIFGYSTEVWKCNSDQHLELRLPRNRGKRPTASLFGSYDQLMAGTKIYGGEDRGALTNKFQLEVDGTIAIYAIHSLLLSYESQLSAMRDRATEQIKGTRQTLKTLDFIRHQFLSISTDTQAIGSDIAELSRKKHSYICDAMDFDPPLYGQKNTADPTFVEWMRKQAEMRTEQLLKLESRVNETITASGNLASTIANLKIQKIVFWLTIVVAILTLVSVQESVTKLIRHIWQIILP